MAEPSSSPSEKTDATSKRCGGCSRTFSVPEILSSSSFRPLGLQTGPPGSKLAGVFFLHDSPVCQGTVLVPLDDLRPLVIEPIPPMPRHLSRMCRQRCQEFRRHDECRADCHFAPFQRMLLRLKSRLLPSQWTAHGGLDGEGMGKVVRTPAMALPSSHVD